MRVQKGGGLDMIDNELLMHICANEHDDHIDISDFIVKR